MASNLTVMAMIKARDLLSSPVVKMASTLRTKLGPAFDRARKNAKILDTRIQCVGKAFRTVGKVVGSLAKVGAILGGFAGFSFKGLIDTGDELGEFSARVGIGVEALQELRYAAERSGVGVDEFDAGIGVLNKNLGMMRAKSGGLYSFLGKVSPALRTQMLGARDTGEAFDLMAAAIAKVPDPARRAALASAAFGRGAGAKMALMAQNGAEGLKALREEARRYGIISQEQADQAGAADDAMINLKRSMVGVANVLASKLLPSITPLLQSLADWIVKNRDLIASRADMFLKKMAEAISEIPWMKFLDAASSAARAIEDISRWIDVMNENLSIVKALLGIGVVSVLISVISFMKSLGQTAVFVGDVLLWIGKLAWANPLLAAAALMVYLWIKNFDEIKQGAEYLGSDLMDLYGSIGEGASNLAEVAGDAIVQAWRDALDWLSGLMEKAGDGIIAVFSGIKDRILSVAEYLKSFARWFTEPLQKMLGVTIAERRQQMPGVAPGGSAPVASLMPRSAAPGGGAEAFTGDIRVRVESDGPRVSIESATSDSRNVGIAANVGRRAMAYGGA